MSTARARLADTLALAGDGAAVIAAAAVMVFRTCCQKHLTGEAPAAPVAAPRTIAA